MSTSNQFYYQNPANALLITEAYERVQLLPDLITQEKIYAAERALNFILISWMSRGLNLWTVKKGLIALAPGQYAYELPPNIIDFLEVVARQGTRQVSGIPSYSPIVTSAPIPVPSYAFDGDFFTTFTFSSNTGSLSFEFGIPNNSNPSGFTTPTYQTIQNLGISFYGKQKVGFKIVAIVGQNNPEPVTILEVAETDFLDGQLYWWNLDLIVNSSAISIVQTQNLPPAQQTDAMSVREVFYISNITDNQITPYSRQEWMQLSNKYQVGQVTSYWVDRQIQPIAYLWQVPGLTQPNLTGSFSPMSFPDINNGIYYALAWSGIEMMPDAGNLGNVTQIPSRFIEAVTSELALRLAIKEGKVELVQILSPLADKEFQAAFYEDEEDVPVRLYGDYINKAVR